MKSASSTAHLLRPTYRGFPLDASDDRQMHNVVNTRPRILPGTPFISLIEQRKSRLNLLKEHMPVFPEYEDDGRPPDSGRATERHHDRLIAGVLSATFIIALVIVIAVVVLVLFAARGADSDLQPKVQNNSGQSVVSKI
jgi:hypothetical protein